LKTVIIYTEQYIDKLTIFLDNNPIPVRGKGNKGALFYARCAYDADGTDFFKSFALFLEGIVLDENPVYGHSPKLKEMTGRLNGMTALSLREYLTENKTLHIEGFITFRMEEYKYQLDRAMMGMIKKLRLL
jgi:hypothetical protein